MAATIENANKNMNNQTASTPQKMLDDNNFAASLQLLSTPFNDIRSTRSLSTSFKERCQSVEGGKKKEEDTIAVRNPQISDDENEWESLAILSDDAAHPTVTLKNESNKTTPSNGENTKDEVGSVVPLKCADLGLKKDAGSTDVDDMADSGPSTLVGSLTDDTIVNVEAVPDLQGCDTNIPCEKEKNNATSVARGGGAGTTRRRRRVSGGLGLMSAYSSQANEPKFSEEEVSAKLEKEQELARKTVTDLRNVYEEKLQELEAQLSHSQEEASKASAGAGRATEQDDTILDLTVRLEQFEATNMGRLGNAEKELDAKNMQLNAVTRQYMNIKDELNCVTNEIQNVKVEKDQREVELRQFRESFDKLQNEEYEKRKAAVFKMKIDMRSLAEEQFGKANDQYREVRDRLFEMNKELIISKTERSNVEAKHCKFVEEAKANKAAAAVESSQAVAKATSLESQLLGLKQMVSEKQNFAEEAIRVREEAIQDLKAAQDSLARQAIRCTELQTEVNELKEVSHQLLAIIEEKGLATNVTHSLVSVAPN